MTEEKCYSLEKDGTYCLGFPNRHALSEKEIEEIFSDYGNVISVRSSGDERGFRFVRFKTLDEAESAVEGLKGHKKIKILPKKPKSSNEFPKHTQQKSSVPKQKKNFNNSNKSNDDDDLNDSLKNDVTSTFHSLNRMKLSQSLVGEHHDSVTKNEETLTNVSETANLMKLLRLRSMRGTVANNFAFDSSSNISGKASKTKCNKNKERKNDNDEFKVGQLNENFETYSSAYGYESENPSKTILQQTTLERLNLSEFNTKSNFVNASNNEEPPELVSTEELKHKSVKGSVCSDEIVKIELAEEVIVANVNEKFSVLYILYLLEKFNPISITEMKTIMQSGIRYCSVYFKSQEDAIAVEKRFDNYDLSGDKLIVRTPELLINEVGYAK